MKPANQTWEEYAGYLEHRLSDAHHANSVLQGAIESVCCGSRTLIELREWNDGPRTKGDGLYSWREERRDLLLRLEQAEHRNGSSNTDTGETR